MYALIIIIHVIASIFLIAVILFQAGRGGGLADTFGGSQLQSLFGTKSKNILTRLTAICAVVFIVTCLLLAIISSRKSKSVVEKVRFPDMPKAETTETLPIEVPKPIGVIPASEVEEKKEAGNKAE